MKPEGNNTPFSRRRFLASGGLAALAGAGLKAAAAPVKESYVPPALPPDAARDGMEPFWGEHQGGILTPIQTQTYFASFDLMAEHRQDVVQLLQSWTAAAARLTAGQTAQALGKDTAVPAPDSGETMGLPPSHLTLTFGFGSGLFSKNGKDRYGLTSQRPAALIDMPKFTGDQLMDSRTGGDLSVQACANDPQVAFHAVRQLARIAGDAVKMRWVQTGFSPRFAEGHTPRNLMGFKDGTNNPSVHNPRIMDKFVWVGQEGPAWMRGGTYLVARRIRIALEHWDKMNLAFQEQTIGRKKYSGAPLGATEEFEKQDFDANDKEGNPVIPENAHGRLAASENNDGAQILRRPYSYNDGVNVTAERWPPWREEMEYDAGLFFVCYQRDVRTGFIKIFEKMSKFDMLNQFVTPVGEGFFACPPGVKEGEFIGQALFKEG